MTIFLDKISELSNFLSARDHSLEEILDHLLRVVLVPINPDSLVFMQTNENDEVYISGTSGVSKAGKTEIDFTYSLHDDYPVSLAIRHGQIVWSDGSEESRIKYAKLKNFPIVVGDKSLIAVPIFLAGTPIAAIVVFSESGKKENSPEKSFLSAVANVFSMYFYRNLQSSPVEPGVIEVKNPSKESKFGDRDLNLTERQLVILRLISEERTNEKISEILGYSESTVRQEIMRIFAKLGCNTRGEAAEIYKSYSKKAQ